MLLNPLRLLSKIKPFGYSVSHIKKLFEQGAVYLLDDEWETVPDDCLIYTEEKDFTFRFGKKQVFMVKINE